MNKAFTQIFLITILLLGVLTACDSNDSDADETLEPTATHTTEPTAQETEIVEAEPTDEAEETSSASVTEEPSQTQSPSQDSTDEADNQPTAEMIVTGENLTLPNLSDTGDFAFVVANLSDPYENEQLPASSGNRVLLLRVAVTNNSQEAITTTAGSFQVVDSDGTRYEAEEAADATQPSLIDAEISAGETLTGFIHFMVPDGQEVVGVEWCPTSDCDQPLSMSFR